MPFSFNTTIASGTTDTVAVPFPYLDKSHVHVRINTVLVDDATLTWDNAAQIRLASAPQAGSAIKVYRDTPKDQPVEVWDTPSIFDGDQINKAVVQLLYIAQEAYDLGTIPQEELDAAVFFVNQTAQQAQASADLAAAEVPLAAAQVTLAAGQVTLAVAAKVAAEAARDSAVAVAGLDVDTLLTKAGNLSGLASPATSRTNLGVYSTGEVDALTTQNTVQYVSQTLTDPQKLQARGNISAAAIGANTFTDEQQAPSFFATGSFKTWGFGGVAGQAKVQFNSGNTRFLTYGVGGDFYSFAGAHVFSAAGRLYGTNDFSTVASAVRLTFGVDTTGFSGSALEPLGGGGVVTGISFIGDFGAAQAVGFRSRYLQYQVGGSWFTAGYA